jgi:8-oxo-dGTP diphosphatase
MRIMSGFRRWDGAEIEAVLSATSRQYLVGDLKRPQELEFQADSRLEIGITAYALPASEDPHGHTAATEFQYVLSGMTEYLDIDTGEEHAFRTGDFYSIEYPTRYAQRSKAGTRILFVKVPSLDDKVVVEASADVRAWLNRSVKSKRIDYSHDPGAPAPNSVHPAAAVALLNGRREILLLRRRDSGNWTLPGGTLEMDESLPEAAVRELCEETGLDVTLGSIIGTYTDPQVRVAYSDGEVRREFTVVFEGHTKQTDVTLDEESTAYRWVSFNALGDLPLADSQLRRLRDVEEFVSSGRQFLS